MCLQAIFGKVMHLTRTEENEIFVQETGRSPIELVFTGSAFKRVISVRVFVHIVTPIQIFSTLVLLFTLVAVPEKSRVFLIEEPEALLYQTVFVQFLSTLERITTQHHIQLIMTSNYDKVIHFFAQVRFLSFKI